MLTLFTAQATIAAHLRLCIQVMFIVHGSHCMSPLQSACISAAGLASMALGEGRLLWPIRPKQHYFEHLLLGSVKRFNVAVRLFVGAMTWCMMRCQDL